MPDATDTLYARTLRALQDASACPACTRPLHAGRCPACGLDVSGPAGLLVWQDSQAVVRALVARQERVAALRAAQSGRVPTTHPGAAGRAPAVRAPVAPPHAAAGRPVVRAPAPVRAVPAAGPPPVRTAPPVAVARVPRPAWRVQTVLQVVGASLLVAASITFLVFAWDVMGLRGRAAVVAVGTLVVFALASWLRSRRLAQGAEAVGAIAVVLLLLDAWALRATDVLAVGGGAGQAGVSAVVCGALLTAWGVRSRLRVGAVAGAALVALAPLAWLPAVPGTAGATSLLLAAGTITAVRAVPPWSAGRAERTVLRMVAGLVLPAAAVTALVGAVTGMERGPWVHVALLGALTLCLALQVAVEARTTGRARQAPPATPARGAVDLRAVWAGGAGVVAALTGAGALAGVAAPASGTVMTAQAAVVGLCVVTAGLLLAQRPTSVRASTAAMADVRTGALAGLSTAGGAAALCALMVVTTTTAGLVHGHPTDLDAPQPGAGWSLGLVAAAALGVAGAHLTHGSAARASAYGARVAVVLVAVTSPVLLAAGPLAHLVVVAGEAGVVVALLATGRRSSLGQRTARAGAVAAAALGVLGVLPEPGWTAAALLTPAAVALLARTWSSSTWSGAASTSTATALLLAAGAAVGPAVDLPAGTVLAPAAALVSGALLVRARRGAPTPSGVLERDTALVGAAAATAVAWAASAASVPPTGQVGSAAAVLVRTAPLVSAAAALVLVVALLRGRTRWGRRHVAVGAGAAAPVAALTVVTVNGALAVPGTVGTALLVTVVGAVALAVAATLRGPGGELARRGAEVSGAVVAATGILVAATTGPAAAAVALLLAAVGAGVWALAARRGWVWWVVLALTTASWWLLLGVRDVVVVEPYTVAPGLAVAAVGAWRVARRRPGAPVLLVAGLAVGTVPTAVLPAVLIVGERWMDRGLLAAGAAAALVTLAASLRRRRPTAGELVAGLGAVLLVIGPLTRAVTGAVTASTTPTGPLLPDGTMLVEVWSWPAVAALAVCAGTARTGRVRRLLDAVTPWALLAAASVPSLLAAVTAPSSPSAVVRVGVLGAGAVTCALVGGATGRRLRAPGARQPTGASRADAHGAGLAGLGLLLTAAVAAATTAVVAAWLPAPVLGTALDLPVLVTGLVALTTAALAARRSDVPLAWVAGGVVMLVPSLLVRSTDARLLLWCGIAAVLLVLGGRARTVPGTARSLPARDAADTPHGTRVAAPGVSRLLTGAALGVVVAGPWAAALAHGLAPGTASPWRVELVAVLALGVGLHHARTWRHGPVSPALRTTLVTLLVLPSLLAVDALALGTARGVLVLIGGAALAWSSRTLLGASLGIGTATLATVALALRGGPEPADLPWTVLGILLLALGARRMAQNPEDASWRMLGVPLSLTLGAPLAALTADPAGWRVATVLTLGITTVVAGAVRRWQAPFVLGAVAVLVTLAVVLSPVAAVALADVDGWVLLAVGGALVLGLGLTYERRVQDAREAVRFVGEMR